MDSKENHIEMKFAYDPRCDDAETPQALLEELYWKYFTETSRSYHPGCIAIAKNPNIGRALLSRASLHTMAVVANPLLILLQLEDPAWVRGNINPKVLVLSKIRQQEDQCLN